MKLFDFDVTLDDLMNLEKRATKITKLNNLFGYLTKFWYFVDGKFDFERWNSTRIGKVNVFIDGYKNLHIDFTTRFSVDEDEISKVIEK